MSSLLEKLRQGAGPKERDVTIGGVVHQVRGMGPIQRVQFLQCLRTAGTTNATVPDHVVVALGLCNAGDVVDDDEQAQILEFLRNQDGQEMNAAAKVVLELSGLGKNSVGAAEKNREPAGAPVPLPAGA